MKPLREIKRRHFSGPVHDADLRIFRAIAEFDTPLLDATLVRLTKSANHSLLWIVAALALARSAGRSGRRAALRGLLSLGITSAFVNLPVKFVARRHRPSVQVPKARRLRRLPTSTSFPSGHSASAFAFATAVAMEMPPLAGPAIGLASAVGFSRIYTGVHYPSDVLAGAAIGAAIANATKRFFPVSPGDPADLKPKLVRTSTDPQPDGAGISIVVNPSAGPALSKSPTDQLRKELPQAEVIEVGENMDFADALKRASLGAAGLGVAGGDGSVNAGAAVAVGQDKPFVVVPAGTLNHLARDLGLDSASDAIEAVKEGRTAEIDVATIDGKTFLNTASIGSYVDLVDAREKLESKIGKWPAVLIALLRVLRHSKPVEVEIDGVRRNVWMIFIGNCRYKPSGFTPSWRERLDDGLLDVRIIDAGRPLSRTRLLIALLTGTLSRCRAYEQTTTRGLKIKSLNGPLRLARDGETFDGSEEFVVEKEDRPLRVYVPAATPPS